MDMVKEFLAASAAMKWPEFSLPTGDMLAMNAFVISERLDALADLAESTLDGAEEIAGDSVALGKATDQNDASVAYWRSVAEWARQAALAAGEFYAAASDGRI